LCFSVNKTQGLFGLPSELKQTSTIIIRVTYAWKEGVSSASVSAVYKNLAEFIGSKTPGCRVFRYGLDAYNRRSQAYEVYDSPEAVQQMVNAALSEGSPLGPMYEVVSPIPGHLLIQGSKASLDAVQNVIDNFGCTPYYTDSQEDVHVAI
jgi:hypothetical protein